MKPDPIGVTAETLTPFAYHSLMVQSGTATLPELISDRAVAFGLAAALGMTVARVGLPAKNYRQHIGAMPWRTSVFLTDSPRLLPPVTRRLNLDAEAGFQKKRNSDRWQCFGRKRRGCRRSPDVNVTRTPAWCAAPGNRAGNGKRWRCTGGNGPRSCSSYSPSSAGGRIVADRHRLF